MAAYGQLCTRFYDLDKPTAPELALEWYAANLPRGPVLEPMCGSGRFLVPLLQLGLDISGADPSAAMLDACRARLHALGLRAKLWQQSMQEFAVAETFAAAFIPASSFCLIAEPQDAQLALKRLLRHLRSGAPLLLEFEQPRGDANPEETVRVVTRGSIQIRLTSWVQYDAASCVEVYRNRYELKRSGRVAQTEDEILRLRCYTPATMAGLLADCGFRDIAVRHLEFGTVATAMA
jgi:SAM-dependent methyltransferase